MSDTDSDRDSKQFDPTPRRLERARDDGDAVRSEDVQAALVGIGLLLGAAVFGATAVNYAGKAAMLFFDQADSLPVPGDHGAGTVISSVAFHIAMPILGLLLMPMTLNIIWLIGSRGLVFAPSKLHMKLSRLSPIANFGQKFGRSGLVDFFKKLIKVSAISAVLWLYLIGQFDRMVGSLRLDAGIVALLIIELLYTFFILITVLNIFFGVIDYLWQRMEFLRRNRMTRKEMTDEMKDSEGDPHMKADRRRRAEEIANRRMLAEIPASDVVIVNPTHYSVALRWDRLRGGAPICVAKGVDEIAARIRERAQEAGVPIRRDPATARAIYAATELGHEIKREHYAAVAAAIRFATVMREKARKRTALR
ncbi:flagellar biosynthesis protein FlhB [Xinfangfangia sp. D13-10-4-6]|uniref:EscU/YscU/HrcU family type III secretion system export apparatus switch protein n=1 Tax=Pseudogemmobacter hezensis TaxID=2737662 RepID=UPI001551671F|nr:flagellar biosynthesis protein FlhB [Pseudogemmobacter hezensis]